MASFGMVFAGAPLWMWIWAIRVAVFINNITASYFSREKVWAAPYELLHGEPFPDASIVMPFGCAALVLLDQKDLTKFQNRCALLVFVHYADEHPLYTYAFYSPRTKRVLFRQDCIFLPSVFPMRIARQAAGLNPSGEPIVPFRSPLCLNGEADSHHSFRNWRHPDPLPPYEDHVSGVKLSQPFSTRTLIPSSQPKMTSGPYHLPYHPAFGEESIIKVHVHPYLRVTPLTEPSGFGEKPTAVPAPDLLPGTNGSSTTAISPIVSTSMTRHDEASVDDGGRVPSQLLPQPESDAQQFLIYLEFPGQGRPLMTYRVYVGMPVRLLYQAIAHGILNCEDHQIRIFIGDNCLLHLGTITDRHFPDLPDVPTVFLYPDCTARVVRLVSATGIGDPIPFPPVEQQPGQESAISRDHIATEVRDNMAVVPSRRVSTRVPKRSQNVAPTDITTAPRRPVGDRWFYDPVGPTASDATRESSSVEQVTQLVSPIAHDVMMMASGSDDHIPFMLGPECADEKQAGPPAPLNSHQRRQMIKRFNTESRRRRRLFKKELQRDWESQVAPAFDQENGNPEADTLLDEEVAYHDFMSCGLDRFDEDLVSKKDDFLDDLRHASLLYGLTPDRGSRSTTMKEIPDALLLQRTEELWAGLRRVYFGEVEESSDPLNSEPIPRTRQSVMDFKAEIAETRARIRQQRPRVPEALNLPFPPSSRKPDDDPGDSQLFPIFPGPTDDSDESMSESRGIHLRKKQCWRTYARQRTSLKPPWPCSRRLPNSIAALVSLPTPPGRTTSCRRKI